MHSGRVNILELEEDSSQGWSLSLIYPLLVTGFPFKEKSPHLKKGFFFFIYKI